MQRRTIASFTAVLSAIVGLAACNVEPVPSVPGPGIGTDLAAGITLISGSFDPGRQPDGNTVIFQGRQGLVVFDTGRHPEHTQKILDYVAQTSQPILAVVNSHWHLDHISGNARLRAAYPQLKVYASSAIEGALSGFLAESRRSSLEFLARDGDPAQQAEARADLATIDSGRALYPDISITAAGERTLAGRPLQLGLEHYTVTEGDVWLYDSPTGVLAAGDLVTLPAPFFDTACPKRWQSALARLESVNFAMLVPGHGAPMSRDDFVTYRHAFDALLACAASQAGSADCVNGWERDAARFLPSDRDRTLARELLDYYLAAVLRGDKEETAALCGPAD
jgi:glyoxylase-like metal-dependent hydrolase (beta-lactamase superfamily II)